MSTSKQIAKTIDQFVIIAETARGDKDMDGVTNVLAALAEAAYREIRWVDSTRAYLVASVMAEAITRTITDYCDGRSFHTVEPQVIARIQNSLTIIESIVS